MLLNHNNEEFTFGRDDFLGNGLTWSIDRLPPGIVATGSEKTNRLFLPLFHGLLELRMRQDDIERERSPERD